MNTSGKVWPIISYMTSSVAYSCIIKVNSFWISCSNMSIESFYLSVVHDIFISFIFRGKSSTMLDCIVIRLLPRQKAVIISWPVKLKDKWLNCIGNVSCSGGSCASRFKPPAIWWYKYIVNTFSLIEAWFETSLYICCCYSCSSNILCCIYAIVVPKLDNGCLFCCALAVRLMCFTFCCYSGIVGPVIDDNTRILCFNFTHYCGDLEMRIWAKKSTKWKSGIDKISWPRFLCWQTSLQDPFLSHRSGQSCACRH